MFQLMNILLINPMKNNVLFILLFLPILMKAQVLNESCSNIIDFGTEKWEQMDYELRQYKVVDSVTEAQLRDLLLIEKMSKTPSEWVYMMHVENVKDTVTLLIEYQNAPYKLPDLKGFFQIDGADILFYKNCPPFLSPTKSSKNFSYRRHLFKVDENDWVEFPGDNCSHYWNLIYHNRILSQYSPILHAWASGLNLYLIDSKGDEQIWIRESDIQSYRWSEHTIILKKEAIPAIQQRSFPTKKFLIKINSDVIYNGVIDEIPKSEIALKYPTILCLMNDDILIEEEELKIWYLGRGIDIRNNHALRDYLWSNNLITEE